MLTRIRQNKPDLLAILLLAAWPFVYYFPAALRQAVFVFGDISLFFVPTHLAYADALHHLQLPFWEPKMMDGFPLFAEGQIGALYPTHPLLYGLLPIDLATNYDILIQIAWVAVGTYLFARVLNLRPASAFLAAFAFSVGGFFTPRLQHMSILATAAWLPWLLWAWESFQRAEGSRRRLRWLALLSLFSGIQLLGGHPQFAFLSAILVSLYSLVRWKSQPGVVPSIGPAAAAPKGAGSASTSAGLAKMARIRERVSEYLNPAQVAPVILVFVIGAGLASVQLLPTFELSSFTDRATGLIPKLFNAFSLRPIHYAMLFDPFLLGNPYPLVSVEVIGYIGLVPLFLALSAPFLRRDRRVVFFGLIALTALFLGLGEVNVFYRMLRFLPLFNYFRVPSRFFFWYTFAAAMLAGIALDALLDKARVVGPLDRAQKIAGLTILVLVAALIALVPSQPVETWLHLWNWLPLALAIFGAWILLGARRGLFSRRTLVMLTLGATVLDLGCFSAVYAKTYNQTDSIADFYQKPAVLDVLKDLTPTDGRVLTSLWIYPVPDAMRASLYPNIFMTYGIPSEIGYTPLIMERAAKYWDRLNAPMLNLSNVRYYLIPQLLPTDPKTEGEDLATPFTLDLQTEVTIPPTPAVKLKVVSSIAQSVDLATGQPVAEVNLTTRDGTRLSLPLRAGLETAEWAYERSDVRQVIQHAMPPVATTFPALSSFPVEAHPGHTYQAVLDVSRSGRPQEITGISVTPFIAPGLIHLQEVSLLQPDGSEISLASLVGRDDLNLVYRDAQRVAVYENPDALPRAFLIHEAHLADDDAALGEMAQDTFDPRRTLILADGAPMDDGGAATAAESVKIEDYQPERVTLSVQAAAAGYLVLDDTWYPGWVARVDGVAAPVRRADYMFRAVAVGAGTHHVTFEYHPTTVYVGAAIGALALLIVVGLIGLSFRKSRDRF